MAKTLLTLTLLIALLVVLLALRITPLRPVDDAYISYRYAQNWAEGHGPVFNPGERVEGYSNFLFVALVALAARIGVTPPLAGRFINVVGVVAVLVLLLHALPGRLRHSKARVPAALTFLVSTQTLGNVLSGLEAPFVAALVLAGALAFEDRRRIAAPLCFLALGLSRPEGIVLGALGGVADLVRAVLERHREDRRRVLLGWILALAVPYAAYSLWRVSYYGHILPNSVHAKMGFPLLEGLERSLRYMTLAVSYYWPLLALPVAGWLARWWHRRSPARGTPEGEPTPELRGVLLLSVGIIGVAFLTGSGDPYPGFLRYLFPCLPLLLVLAVLATERLLAAARGRARIAVAAFTVALLLVQIRLVAPPLSKAHRSPRPLGERLAAGFVLLTGQDRRPHQVKNSRLPLGLHAVAAWLSDNAREDEWLATAEIGIGAYYSGVRVIDTFGLITEHVGHLPGRPGSKGDPDFVFRRYPDYFVFKKRTDCLCAGIPADLMLFRDPRLRRDYDFVRMFRDGGRVILLFKRRTHRAKPRIAYDFCTQYAPELVVLRDRKGRPVEHPPWVWYLIGRKYARISDEARQQELLSRFQPVIRGEIADFEAAELMREWLAQWGCYIRQLPVVRSRHDLAITHRLTIPERALLSFTIGWPPDAHNQPQAADVIFEVEIEDASGEVATVFVQGITPAKNPVWHQAEVDLGAFAGHEVKVSLRVYQEDGASPRTIDDSGWLDMLLLERDIPSET